MNTIYRACELIHDVMSLCALRFDGYAYEAARGKCLWKIADRVICRQRPLGSVLDNLAAFFAIQRSIGHSGYDICTNRTCRAFALLFFELYDVHVPVEYRFEEWAFRWEREAIPRLETCLSDARRVWTEIADFDSELAAAGCSLTSQGALRVPNAPGWPIPGCIYWHGVPFSRPPSVCVHPQGRQPDLNTSYRELRLEELHAIVTDPALFAIRRYFEFHGCFETEMVLLDGRCLTISSL